MSAHSAETITIASPYAASHSGSAAIFKILEQANRDQNRYNFILEFKPGGEQIIAVRYMDEQPQTRLAIVAPKFVEHVSSGKLNQSDYDPVWALGDACWAVITNVGDERRGVASLRGQGELVVGGVGFGNSAHLTALQLAQQYGFKVRYVPFKSNFDALILMAADGSVNMVLERVSNYEQIKLKNSKLKMLAMSCPQRHPQAPNVKTLLEQGITAPYVFNIVIANRNMPAIRHEEISKILTKATQSVGAKEIQQSSDMRPPQFDNFPTTMYYNKSLMLSEQLLKKYHNQIQAD
jgi:tripartite-type tricarboxylate transporter receptor subunit TctC